MKLYCGLSDDISIQLGSYLVSANLKNFLLFDKEILFRMKEEEEDINWAGLKYLQNVRSRVVFLRIKGERKNAFITIEKNTGHVLYSMSLSKVCQSIKVRRRMNKLVYREAGKQLKDYLKRLKLYNVVFCYRVLEVYRYKGLYREIKKDRDMNVLGSLMFPILGVGKRKLRRYKRKKGTRRFR